MFKLFIIKFYGKIYALVVFMYLGYSKALRNTPSECQWSTIYSVFKGIFFQRALPLL